MDDASIIELYFSRNERALKETENKYGRLCMSVAGNILGDFNDTEECVNDAYLAVWKRIPPERPEFFAAFLCKITKNLAFKKVEYACAAKRNKNLTFPLDELADCVSGKGGPEDELYLKELSLAISRFLHTQKERDRVIFVKRYWFFEPLTQIADETGLRKNTVSSILFRQRRRLKEYLLKEGFDL